MKIENVCGLAKEITLAVCIVGFYSYILTALLCSMYVDSYVAFNVCALVGPCICVPLAVCNAVADFAKRCGGRR